MPHPTTPPLVRRIAGSALLLPLLLSLAAIASHAEGPKRDNFIRGWNSERKVLLSDPRVLQTMAEVNAAGDCTLLSLEEQEESAAHVKRFQLTFLSRKRDRMVTFWVMVDTLRGTGPAVVQVYRPKVAPITRGPTENVY